MNIHEYLKSIGVTKTELASEIGLSRPTLNQYVKLFEEGKTIDNERYDIIFKRLFLDENGSRELFDKRLEGIKYLLDRDKKYDIGDLKPEAADIVAKIHNHMVQDMSREGWDEKIYNAIIILLLGYRNNRIFRELAGYFTDLNMDANLQELSAETKAYYAYFYRCFREIRENPLKFDQDAYDGFVKRKAEVLREREERNNRVTEKVRKAVEKALKELKIEYHARGIETTENEMITEVIRRIRG